MSLLLGATGRVWHRSIELTAAGSESESWTPSDQLPCRIAPIGGGLMEGQSLISDRTTHIATLPAYTEVEEGDQLQIEEGLYNVTAVRKRTFDEFVRRVECAESDETIDLDVSGS